MGSARWLSWILGIALLIAVVWGTLHFSEERAFLRLAEHAKPWWLVAALFLQAGTYMAQGGIWRLVSAAAGFRLSRRAAFELGLAKLFADQALPSAGLSSGILIAKALEQRKGPPAAIRAAVLLNVASYHLTYAMAVTGALVILTWRGNWNALIVVAACLLLLFSLGTSTAIVVLSGRRHDRLAAIVPKFSPIQHLFEFITGADARLIHNPTLMAGAIGLQTSIVVLDAATVWTLIGAVGTIASPSGVFVSFMIARLARTMGIVPGGLGAFEATSVLSLRAVGVDLATALSATLLFRGLSFWLPMLPGYWYSQRIVSGQ